MEVNNIAIKDGDSVRISVSEAPSAATKTKQTSDGFVAKKKRRRGKSKRKVMKPYTKIVWRDGKRQERSKRINRFRKSILAKTHAPFNNNQFLMEIHKPDPENDFQILQTPSARTRESSFSVESEENYFYSLPEDEEEFLTKEFSSVYEDAQSERLSNMSKNELIQEYLLLEAKYDNVVRRNEKGKLKSGDNDDIGFKDTSNDMESIATDINTSGTSEMGSASNSLQDVLQRLKEQEDQINELKLANERLRTENEKLCQKSQCSSSEDSESDSSSTSVSCSSNSSRANSPAEVKCNGDLDYDIATVNGHDDHSDEIHHNNMQMNGHGQHLSTQNE